MIRNRIRTTDRIPRPAAIALAATGMLTSDCVIAAMASPMPASAVNNRIHRISSIVSHAFPPTLMPPAGGGDAEPVEDEHDQKQRHAGRPRDLLSPSQVVQGALLYRMWRLPNAA